MPLMINRRALMIAGAATIALPRRARAADKPIRIGVLTDMSGPYSGNTGAGSVIAAQLAIEDFTRNNPSIKVELFQTDLQMKPDVAVSIAREWYDNRDVDLITDVPLSAAAFAISDLAKQKDKLAIFTGAAASSLTGEKCGPNHLHYVYDTYSLAKVIADAVVKDGGESWFFITTDNVGTASLQGEAADFVKKAGGKVLGNVITPAPNSGDFSSFLLQAQGSRASVIALANSGSDAVNCVKQAADFGIARKGQQQRIACLMSRVTDVHAMGLENAQGVLLAEQYYWNLNAGTREFGLRYASRNNGRFPNAAQAGQYSAVLHYLKAVAAVGPERAKASGLTAINQMKATPIEDQIFGKGKVRRDGRVVLDTHLFQVKSPAESKEPWDYFTYKRTIPGDEAFRPMDQGGCKLV